MPTFDRHTNSRLVLAGALFLSSTLFSAFLAWSVARPTHVTYDLFVRWFDVVPWRMAEPASLMGIGMFFLYLAIELPILFHSHRVAWVVRKFKKSIFYRFVLLVGFFAVFGGFLFGPGLVCLFKSQLPRAFSFLFFGVYALLIAVFFAVLPTAAAAWVGWFKKRDIAQALLRMAFLIAGVVLLFGAFIG